MVLLGDVCREKLGVYLDLTDAERDCKASGSRCGLEHAFNTMPLATCIAVLGTQSVPCTGPYHFQT